MRRRGEEEGENTNPLPQKFVFLCAFASLREFVFSRLRRLAL
jgi:hypothetical protein